MISECFKFHQRSQSTEEIVTQYLSELRKLEKTCDPSSSLTKVLCDKFVCGLRDQSIQKHLLSKDGLDIPRALTVAQGIEAAELNSKQFHDNPVVHEIEKIRPGQSTWIVKKVEPSLPCPCCREFAKLYEVLPWMQSGLS